MIDISKLSSRFGVRKMDENDVDVILELCRRNTQFYKYCEAEPTKEQVLSDLQITPPGIEISDKYYLGFYDDDVLIAVMDLIDGYPKKETAYIGFFMMNKDHQGRQIGSTIIDETAKHLKSIGKTSIRLAIDKDNPQSNNFWKKNGFAVVKEVDRNGRTILVAEKPL